MLLNQQRIVEMKIKTKAHKEKMRRKKDARAKRRSAGKCFLDMLGVFDEAGIDPNRVVVGDCLKSKFYENNVEMGLTEEFIGGFKTLRNDPFFTSVVLDGGSMKKIEDDCINRGHYFHSTGSFTGIKHIAYWSEEYGCFLAWRLIPNKLNKEPYGYSIDLKDVA